MWADFHFVRLDIWQQSGNVQCQAHRSSELYNWLSVSKMVCHQWMMMTCRREGAVHNEETALCYSKESIMLTRPYTCTLFSGCIKLPTIIFQQPNYFVRSAFTHFGYAGVHMLSTLALRFSLDWTRMSEYTKQTGRVSLKLDGLQASIFHIKTISLFGQEHNNSVWFLVS